jgi:hypothetical protein
VPQREDDSVISRPQQAGAIRIRCRFGNVFPFVVFYRNSHNPFV